MNISARLVFVAYAGRLMDIPSTIRGWASRRDRLDILARLVIASLYPGGRILNSNALIVYFENHPALVLDPHCLPESIEDEMRARSILASVLQGCLCRRQSVSSVNELVEMLRAGGYKVYTLVEGGVDIAAARPWLEERVAYIIGTHVDPPPIAGATSISIGPYSYLASHVAAFINYLHQYCTGQEVDDDG